MGGDTLRWMAIVCIALLDFILARHLGIRVVIEPWFPALMIWLLTIYLACRAFRPDGRLALLAGAVAQYLGLGCTLTVLSCLVAALHFPLIDNDLARADAALGFDWLGVFAFVQAHPWLKWALQLGYNSTVAQTALLFVWLNATGRSERTSEFINLCAVTLAIIVALSAVLPAAGAFPKYNVLALVNADYLALLGGLRDGSLHELSLSNIDGIVTFPSFHTALGIIFTYTARNIRYLFPTIAAANVALIGATPSIGGHYFVDLIAGAAVTAAAIALVRARLTDKTTVSGACATEPV